MIEIWYTVDIHCSQRMKLKDSIGPLIFIFYFFYVQGQVLSLIRWIILTFTWRIGRNFGIEIHVSKMINLNDFADPLSFPLLPLQACFLWFRAKYLKNYVMDCHKIGSMHSCPSQIVKNFYFSQKLWFMTKLMTFQSWFVLTVEC